MKAALIRALPSASPDSFDFNLAAARGGGTHMRRARYLKADWKRWSVVERVAAIVLVVAFIALYVWSWQVVAA
jgi:hypothetical protein